MRVSTLRVSRWLSVPLGLLLWLRVVFAGIRLVVVLAVLAFVFVVFYGVPS